MEGVEGVEGVGGGGEVWGWIGVGGGDAGADGEGVCEECEAESWDQYSSIIV